MSGALNCMGGTTHISKCEFSYNSAGFGSGAISSNSTVYIDESSLCGNTAGTEGGALDNGGTMLVSNSTLDGNSADERGGAVYTDKNSLTTLTHVTISNNRAKDGGGIYKQSGSFHLRNSVIAMNQGGDCAANLDENIHNLISDGSTRAAIKGDPKLGRSLGLPLFEPLKETALQ